MRLSARCRMVWLLVGGILLGAACSTDPKPPVAVAPTVVATVAPDPPATPTPVPVVPSTATPAPPPTARPAPVIPLIYSKLSGRSVESPASLQRRPLVVKIDNAAAARPQSGLSEADVVYETVTEGEITRFTAVYLAGQPDPLGPIRSARLSDLDLPYQFDGILVHVGGGEAVQARLRKLAFANLDLYYVGPHYRATDRRAPHNVYSTAAALREYAEGQGWARPVNLPGFSFYWGDPPPLAGARAAAYVDFNYARWSRSEYAYDAQRGGYLRFSDGVAHVDRNTGEQLLARNLVVQFVRSWLSDVVEDVNGARSRDFELVGEGKALIFRDGQVAPAKWARQTLNDLTQFTDETGRPVVFKPGNLWIHPVDQVFPVEYR